MNTKKEIKDSYKEMKFKAGVFQIRNLKDNKIFIDSSPDLVSIWNRYKFQLNGGRHHNKLLQEAWTEDGQQNFAYEILSEIKHESNETINYGKEAKKLAELFIEERQPYGDKGYNSRI